nr:MAG TPA: hypothetical protein [Bacteriophage sp.]
MPPVMRRAMFSSTKRVTLFILLSGVKELWS